MLDASSLSRTAMAIFITFLPASCLADQNNSAAVAVQSPRPRPRIGVAVEGGGALGFAHIGVLRWFEEHRIPIDYIDGTSMGGLVGGLYATGKSQQQLEDFVREQDWDEIIAGETAYEDLSLRRKE